MRSYFYIAMFATVMLSSCSIGVDLEPEGYEPPAKETESNGDDATRSSVVEVCDAQSL